MKINKEKNVFLKKANEILEKEKYMNEVKENLQVIGYTDYDVVLWKGKKVPFEWYEGTLCIKVNGKWMQVLS